MPEDAIAAVKRRVEAELRQKAADDVLVARLRGTCARFALRPSCLVSFVLSRRREAEPPSLTP